MDKDNKGSWLRMFLVLFVTVIVMDLITNNIKPSKTYSNKDFDIEKFISKTDKDEDGINDQADILLNAKVYILTKPKYKSKYYETGYPDDEYGVCTDVVAISLKNAGYDLMELVNEDILNHEDEYDIEKIDKNIDFRRVKNLKVWFKRNAISLTKNTKKIEEWQAGDIVIFKSHIGIISDKRNKKGIPYVIHHADAYQKSYEEDILKKYEIEGHYRISE